MTHGHGSEYKRIIFCLPPLLEYANKRFSVRPGDTLGLSLDGIGSNAPFLASASQRLHLQSTVDMNTCSSTMSIMDIQRVVTEKDITESIGIGITVHMKN